MVLRIAGQTMLLIGSKAFFDGFENGGSPFSGERRYKGRKVGQGGVYSMREFLFFSKKKKRVAGFFFSYFFRELIEFK